jgi:hypothetical protein
MSGFADHRFAYRRSVRYEDGCTRLNGSFRYIIGGERGNFREDLQWTQVLVPIRHMSLNGNVCGLRRCLSVGYRDEEIPLQDIIFLDGWDVNRSKD